MLSSATAAATAAVGGSVLGIQCRVLTEEFATIDDAGLGGEPPPNDMGSSVDMQFCFVGFEL